MFEKVPITNPYKNKETHETEEEIDIENILKYGKNLERPNPCDFIDIYSKKEIAKDLTELEFRKKDIRRKIDNMDKDEREVSERNAKRAQAFEIVVADQAHDGQWFGENAMISRTSEFDDIINGTDFVVEIVADEDESQEVKRIAFAVDASTSSSPEVIQRKIERNIKKIKNTANPPGVKYFNSQIFGEKKGKIENLLPVVIGAERKNIDELFDLFAQLKNLEKTNGPMEEKKELRNRLANHPLQAIFLEQIKDQLNLYREIFKEIPNKDEECEELIFIIDQAVKEKEEQGITSNSLVEDRTYKNIKEFCKKTK